jgi:phosphate starvation-inducible membrane PsiE
MGPIKVYPSILLSLLVNLGLHLCLVAMLSCYIWVMVVLMDNNDESYYTFLLSLWMLNTRPYV